MLVDHWGILQPIGAIILTRWSHCVGKVLAVPPTKRTASEYTQAVADALTGRYKAKRWNLEKLSEKTGIKYFTLRRMMAGEAEINVRELRIICGVLGVSAEAVLDEALNEYGGIDKLVSEATDTTDDLEAKRRQKQKEAAAMSVDELEAQKHAAVRDRELDTDEPDLP